MSSDCDGRARLGLRRWFVTKTLNDSCIPSTSPSWTLCILRGLANNYIILSLQVWNTVLEKVLYNKKSAYNTRKHVKIQPVVNPRRLNALLFGIYLKMAPSCWQPSNGVSPTFTRRFNNYGLLCGLMYVYSCLYLYSFIQDIRTLRELTLHIENVGECHAPSIYVLCKLFVCL